MKRVFIKEEVMNQSLTHALTMYKSTHANYIREKNKKNLI